MNKKLIAIAIASVMAAPVAMADIKISGRVGVDFTSKGSDNPTVEDSLALSDSGHTRLQFDGTAGNAYARLALDERYGRDRNGTGGTEDNRTKRDQYLGYKWGSTSLQAGRMAGAAKNIEKDRYIGTFLETRSTIANSYTASAYGSSSFINDILQLGFKAGPTKIKLQFGPTDKANSNNGHIGASITGKGGSVNYWLSYNNGSADGNGSLATYPSQSNLKVGAAMKFGKVKVSLNYTDMDTDGAPATAGVATDSLSLGADMSFGNGLSGDITYATRGGNVAADDADFLRIALMKKLGKKVAIYGGYTSTDFDAVGSFDTDEFGVGMVVKF